MASQPVWRCRGCGTFQVESAECFVCNRSATSCSTCANFRSSIAAGVGYCAIDRRREPLSGDEQRACWTDASAGVVDGLFSGVADPARVAGDIGRGLIELDARVSGT